MTPTCTPIGPIISGVLAGDINSLINTYLRINVANITGSVLSGFDGSGNPVYTTMSSSQWIDGLIPNSITYTSGNVGIGTMAPTAMLDVVGNVAVSGNVTSANPTLPNHLTTMNYVDTQIRGICVSLG